MTGRGGQRVIVSAYRGPRGFEWAIPGALGGAPRPGIVRPLASDLEALERVGTTVLVTLTEEWTPPVDALRESGILSLYLPIPDMDVPGLDAALKLVDEVEDRIAENGTAVYHCRGGRGRTGTLIACHFVRRGMTGDDAIAVTRRCNPKWIETDGQLEFVRAFHERLSA